MIDFNSYAVKSTTGSIDESATLSKFEGELSAYIAEASVEQEVIANAVDQAFEDNKGTRLNVPFVVNAAVQSLNPLPQNYAVLTKRVHSYVSAQTKGENSLLAMKKGAQGFICRRADLPTDTK